MNQMLDPEGQSALFLQAIDSNSMLLAVLTLGTLLTNCYLCATRTIPIYQVNKIFMKDFRYYTFFLNNFISIPVQNFNKFRDFTSYWNSPAYCISMW